MAFIIVHVEDPNDIESYQPMPDIEGMNIEVFDSSTSAFHFIEGMGMGTFENIRVMRVQ